MSDNMHRDESRFLEEDGDIWRPWFTAEDIPTVVRRNAARTAQLKRLLDDALVKIAELEARLKKLEGGGE